MIVTAAMFYLVLGHRSGRVKVLNRVGLFSERVAGLPPWAALPLGVLSGSLLIAVFGMYLTVLLIGVALYASMGWVPRAAPAPARSGRSAR